MNTTIVMTAGIVENPDVTRTVILPLEALRVILDSADVGLEGAEDHASDEAIEQACDAVVTLRELLHP